MSKSGVVSKIDGLIGIALLLDVDVYGSASCCIKGVDGCCCCRCRCHYRSCSRGGSRSRSRRRSRRVLVRKAGGVGKGARRRSDRKCPIGYYNGKDEGDQGRQQLRFVVAEGRLNVD